MLGAGALHRRALGGSGRGATRRSTIGDMKVVTGTVIDGKVVIEGDTLVEGAKVTILAQDEVESFEASPEQEDALLAAIAEADRAEFVSSQQLLDNLRRTV